MAFKRSSVRFRLAPPLATYSSGSNLALGKERPPLGLRERNEGEVASLEGIKS
jgi:hypothetical protein